MFKFAIILGCALLATSTIAAVVETFNPAEVIARSDTAIEEIDAKARDVGKAVLQISMRGENVGRTHVAGLKNLMNATLKSIQSTVAKWEVDGGEVFKKNNCGTYLDDLMDLASIVQDELDGCVLISTISSAFRLSRMFNTSATAIEKLGKIKALVAKCNSRKCQTPEGEEVIDDPTLYRNTIVSNVQQLANNTCATIQVMQDEYQQSVENADIIHDCVRKSSDYHRYIVETSKVLLDTVECVVHRVEETEE